MTAHKQGRGRPSKHRNTQTGEYIYAPGDEFHVSTIWETEMRRGNIAYPPQDSRHDPVIWTRALANAEGKNPTPKYVRDRIKARKEGQTPKSDSDQGEAAKPEAIPENKPAKPAPTPKASPMPQSKGERHNGCDWHMFDSVEQFMAASVGVHPVNTLNNEFYRDKSESSGSSWYGLNETVTVTALQSIINAGWEEGVAKVSDKVNSFTLPDISSVRRRQVWNDSGDELNMDKVYSGNIDSAWRTTRRTGSKQPAKVKIFADFCRNADADAESMFLTGAVAYTLADKLYSAGHNVEVILVGKAKATSSSNRQTGFQVTAKGYQSPMDLATLAGTVCLPGFFRGIGILGLVAHYTEKTGFGLGIAQQTTLEDLDTSDADHAFLVPNTINSVAQANDYLRDSLESFA